MGKRDRKESSKASKRTPKDNTAKKTHAAFIEALHHKATESDTPDRAPPEKATSMPPDAPSSDTTVSVKNRQQHDEAEKNSEGSRLRPLILFRRALSWSAANNFSSARAERMSDAICGRSRDTSPRVVKAGRREPRKFRMANHTRSLST
jgi:hypothetical protein